MDPNCALLGPLRLAIPVRMASAMAWPQPLARCACVISMRRCPRSARSALGSHRQCMLTPSVGLVDSTVPRPRCFSPRSRRSRLRFKSGAPPHTTTHHGPYASSSRGPHRTPTAALTVKNARTNPGVRRHLNYNLRTEDPLLFERGTPSRKPCTPRIRNAARQITEVCGNLE